MHHICLHLSGSDVCYSLCLVLLKQVEVVHRQFGGNVIFVFVIIVFLFDDMFMTDTVE